MNEILVKTENVSKKFARTLKKSLWYGLNDMKDLLFGVPRDLNRLKDDEFWAIRNVSFELRRGECLGLIGPNGGGKSTLLRMLNGLITPDSGSITIRGRVGALLELGAGFNPVLTGRENVYVNGQILGLTKKEIEERLDAVMDFAEIKDFMDMPVQNYSSGMKVRLGFAIAAQIEPDVLIIDEVLAVGDLGFQIKCYNSIQKRAVRSAIIIVSHNMQHISRLASKVLAIHHGKQLYLGDDVGQGIQAYFRSFAGEEWTVVGKPTQILDLAVHSLPEKSVHPCTFDDLEISFRIKRKEFEEGQFLVVVVFFDSELRPVSQYTSDRFELLQDREDLKLEVRIQSLPLASGKYGLSIWFYKYEAEKMSVYSFHRNITHLHVSGDVNFTRAYVQMKGKLALS